MSPGSRESRGRRPCLMLTANRGYALANSRTSLIGRFVDAGWEVVLATADDPESRKLCRRGVRLEPVDFSRGGLSAAKDVRTYRRLREIISRHRPTLLQNYNAKPLILGSLAGGHEKSDDLHIVSTITGLGRSLYPGRVGSRLSGMAYRMALRYNDIAVFQNMDDKSLFAAKGWVHENKARVVVSSGVDLEKFEYVDRRERGESELCVTTIGRLLGEKGIPEFAEVARRLHEKGMKARFRIAGEEEPLHPDAISSEWLQTRKDVDYLGRLADVRQLLAESDVFLFASRYREGVPRVVLEAAASGLPVVAYDVPGVREVVRNGETGFLVEPVNVEQLERRTIELLSNATLRHVLGLRAREFVERHFSIEAVDAQYLDIYREIGIVGS